MRSTDPMARARESVTTANDDDRAMAMVWMPCFRPDMPPETLEGLAIAFALHREKALTSQRTEVIEACARVAAEERAKIARFVSLYDTWCAGWGMTRNQSAANEAAREIAEMIGKWDWSVPIPDDDDAAEDHIARIVQGWYQERNERASAIRAQVEREGDD